MIRTLKNISGETIVLTDFQGISIAPNESIDGTQFGVNVLRESIDVNHNLLHGHLSCNDGFITSTGLQALNVIREAATQMTSDGKQIITASDRPANNYRYYTSRGDNMTTGKIGEGPHMTFWVPPGEMQSVDVQFVQDCYAKDGQAHYYGVEDHCHVEVQIICPAGVPFPAPTGNGNYDLVGTTWTPNITNTGKYYILGTETPVFRFVNMYPLMKDAHLAYIESAEPQFLPTPYIIRTTVHNTNTTNHIRVCFVFGMYRPVTIN